MFNNVFFTICGDVLKKHFIQTTHILSHEEEPLKSLYINIPIEIPSSFKDWNKEQKQLYIEAQIIPHLDKNLIEKEGKPTFHQHMNSSVVQRLGIDDILVI